MMKPSVKIKGIRDGLLVSLGKGEWTDMEEALLEQLQAQSGFLKGANLTLEVGDLSLNTDEVGKLRDHLSEKGVSLRAILSSSTITQDSAQSLGLGTRISIPHPQRNTRPRDTVLTGERAILVKRTLRSGFSLTHPGHITIVGDVNPGAEVIAGGSVVVWGRLKGVVHAGAEGDESAYVCALVFTPTQLRIAGEIAIPPKKRGKLRPEIAYLLDGQVVAEPWETG